MREGSHRLSAADDGTVTFVDFLDFECEDCRAETQTQRGQHADVDHRNAPGVTGTPSFFLNGEPFTPEAVEDLTRAPVEALAR